MVANRIAQKEDVRLNQTPAGRLDTLLDFDAKIRRMLERTIDRVAGRTVSLPTPRHRRDCR